MQDATDLAGGKLPPQDRDWTNADLEDRRQKRDFRKTMFRWLKFLVISYLAVLLVAFGYLFFCKIDAIAEISNAGAFVFMSVSLGLFTAVPLSLAITMRHISTDANGKGDLPADFEFSPAQMSLIRAVLEIAKSAKG